ncbi:MAG: homoserine dehydrogenase [Deltaproteobacteria bacterium]|nr:homoserine dehydrogenase [Candidatus Anaeroferrophillus wilburensis]MBN2888186.1 homoserine dehydrogenase [Deltaproteobacteria bacterium]
MKTIGIGLIGLGTIGTGVARVLKDNADLIAGRLGARLELVKVADLDIVTDRGITFPDGVLTTNVGEVLENKDIAIVIELIGGYEPAKTFIRRALAAGKQVVTANKALLAKHGDELFQLAAASGVDFYYEASVGGGIPIIKVMRESLPANHIISVSGILNGTCNYILSKMADEGRAYTDVLAEAQELGYAEADPTFDVEGIDTAHKLAILAALAFGTPINVDGIHVEGITNVQPVDLEFAQEFGYKIKLLAIAKSYDNKVEARVHPTMIPQQHMLAKIDGVYNAVYIDADMLGPSLYYGQGAGMLPTASAVIADVIDIARNILPASSQRVPFLGSQPQAIKTLPYLPIEEISCKYYLRFTAHDQPGVLSSIAGILGQHRISIASVIQKGRNDAGGTVPIVMQTHQALERDLQYALKEIASLPVIADRAIVIRMETDL